MFDPKDFSDTELFDRAMKARHMISVAIQGGHEELIHSIEITLAVIEEEQEYRLEKSREDQRVAKELQAANRMKRQRRTKKGKSKGTKTKPLKNPSAITLGHIPGVDD